MPGRMALPKNIQWVTFDVYGTLIDWESGIADAFEREAKRDGFPIDRTQVVDLFLEATKEIQGGSYELYAEVLRQAAIKIAKEIGWPLEPSRSGFLPDSVARWGAFKETMPQMRKFMGKYQTGLISNIDDKLLGLTRRHIPADVDLVVTAQQVRSYKPDPAHFNEFARRIGGKKGWIHIGAGLYTDIEPATKLKVPTIWVNRRKEEIPPGGKKPTAEVKTLLEAAKLLGL
jgi:2-haloacid dehalogenase/putative hydrolase of the HAD superfamily